MEVDGDLLLTDMGQGCPFRAGKYLFNHYLENRNMKFPPLIYSIYSTLLGVLFKQKQNSFFIIVKSNK